MKLNDKEREVLAAAQHDPDISVPKLARRLHMRSHTIRHCLNRLEQRKIIRRLPVINPLPLGFSQYQIYLSLIAKQEKIRTALIDFLAKSERVPLLRLLGGEYEILVCYYARSAGELSDFLDSLTETFGEIIFDRAIMLRQYYLGFGRRYLSKQAIYPQVEISEQPKLVKIDDLDHRILRGLNTSSFASDSELARQLRIPPATLQYRLKGLKSSAIYLGKIYGVSASNFEMQTFSLLVTSRSLKKVSRERFINFCRAEPNIVNLKRCIGSWDYEMDVEVADHNQALSISRKVQSEFGHQLSAVKLIPCFEKFGKVANYPFKNHPQKNMFD